MHIHADWAHIPIDARPWDLNGVAPIKVKAGKENGTDVTIATMKFGKIFGQMISTTNSIINFTMCLGNNPFFNSI